MEVYNCFGPGSSQAPETGKLPQEYGNHSEDKKISWRLFKSAGDQLGIIGWKSKWKPFWKVRRTLQLQGLPQRFTYNQLSIATGGFREDSKLGQGGSGCVYRGVLPSSIPVAVKKLNTEPCLGKSMTVFKDEINIISQLSHRNLIELRGWCEDQARKEYMLVYELMPNGSLEKLLFKPGEGTTCLSWPQRFNILVQTANALDYLHQGWRHQVIHRDIKCSNILLDQQWNAKVADFGIARVVDHHSLQDAVTSRPGGTMGYIAPEVFSEGRFTDKTDVFAFGVVVLEVACGRRVLSGHAAHEMGLVYWIQHSLSRGDLFGTVDKRLGDYDRLQMKMMLMIGLACCDLDPRERPSMRQIIQMLRSDHAEDVLMKMMVRIEEKEISKFSIRGVSTSDPTKIDLESKKKIWWRRSGKQIVGELRRASDDQRSVAIGCGPFRNENLITLKLEGLPAQRFSYKQLRAATGAFSEKSEIGSGSFGTVYRGELPSGILVAVRKMKMIGTQGEAKMFITELSVLSQIKHQNVIQLLGWGEDLTKKEYFLVYELMRNGSLEDVLFEQAEKEIAYDNLADVLLELAETEIACLSCQQRFNIITSIATALDYMHHGCNQKVIHRNIKARNVLLDERGNAKLGGFGLAILVDHRGEVGFEDNIKGTLGYISPEYQSEGILTDKMDVYSFGVLVLEVVCGRQAYARDLPKGEAYLTDWVRKSLGEGLDLRSVIDRRLGDYDTRSMEVLLTVGLLCSQGDHLARPSMVAVLRMLAGDVPVPAIWEMKMKVNYQFYSNEPTLSSNSGPDRGDDELHKLTSKRIRRRKSRDSARVHAKTTKVTTTVHLTNDYSSRLPRRSPRIQSSGRMSSPRLMTKSSPQSSVGNLSESYSIARHSISRTVERRLSYDEML